jgi:hypothetical protein
MECQVLTRVATCQIASSIEDGKIEFETLRGEKEREILLFPVSS